MNRQILFKAKRKDNGEWIQGYYYQIWQQGYILWGMINNMPDMVEVNPDTLCQCTGLTDERGQKIWENDICNRKEKYPEIVTYNKGDWQLDYSYVFGKEMHTDACNLGFYVCERNCVEVIGNIFDKEKVTSAEIISRKTDGKPYYGIKYKKVGEDHYTVGYSSYYLDYVIDWLNNCFEFCGESKIVVNVGKDTNVPSNDGWIPVEERLPEDCEEIVLVQVSGKPADNILFDNAFEFALYEKEEGWMLDNYPEWKNPDVIAWQSLPKPYRQPKKEKSSCKEHIMSRFMKVE